MQWVFFDFPDASLCGRIHCNGQVLLTARPSNPCGEVKEFEAQGAPRLQPEIDFGQGPIIGAPTRDGAPPGLLAHQLVGRHHRLFVVAVIRAEEIELEVLARLPGNVFAEDDDPFRPAPLLDAMMDREVLDARGSARLAILLVLAGSLRPRRNGAL
jgi:hypothetical protein